MPTMETLRRVLRSTLPRVSLCVCLSAPLSAQELSVPLDSTERPSEARLGQSWQWAPEGRPLDILAIDVHQSGVICGIEGRRHRFFLAEAEGGWIRFGDAGSGEFLPGFPTKVHAGGGLTLFTFDPDARTMDVYDLRGRWEQSLDLGQVVEEAGFTLLDPIDFCVDRAGNVYLLDGEAGRLFWFEAEGLGVTVVGEWDEWSVHQPVDLDVDGRGNLYLLETHPVSVRMLDSSGQVLAQRGAPEDPPEGWTPDIMEVDLWGNLFLAMHGQSVFWMGSMASQAGLWVPTDLAGGICDLAADEGGRVLAAGCEQGLIREIRLEYGAKDTRGDCGAR